MRSFAFACSLALVASLLGGCDDDPPATFDAGPRRDAGGDAMDGGGVVVLPDGAVLLPDGAILRTDGGPPPLPDGGPPIDAQEPPVRDCPANDLGSAVGEDVVVDTVDGRGNAFFPSCAEILNGEDLEFLWTAPSAGEWVFDTFGSDYDTVLALYPGDDCAGESELACNDNAEVIQSVVRWTLAEGEAVLIVVNEFRSFDRGDFRLSIHRDVPTNETVCDDGADEDRDGVSDCDDVDCAGVGSCP